MTEYPFLPGAVMAFTLSGDDADWMRSLVEEWRRGAPPLVSLYGPRRAVWPARRAP